VAGGCGPETGSLGALNGVMTASAPAARVATLWSMAGDGAGGDSALDYESVSRVGGLNSTAYLASPGDFSTTIIAGEELFGCGVGNVRRDESVCIMASSSAGSRRVGIIRGMV
jgi:hypothetical protein